MNYRCEEKMCPVMSGKPCSQRCALWVAEAPTAPHFGACAVMTIFDTFTTKTFYYEANVLDSIQKHVKDTLWGKVQPGPRYDNVAFPSQVEDVKIEDIEEATQEPRITMVDKVPPASLKKKKKGRN